MKKEVYLTNQTIEIIKSDEFSSKKEFENLKILFTANENNQKLLIFLKNKKRLFQKDFNYITNNKFDQENIKTVNFFDINLDKINELIIGTNAGNIYIIEFKIKNKEELLTELEKNDHTFDIWNYVFYDIKKINLTKSLIKIIEELNSNNDDLKQNKNEQKSDEQKAIEKFLLMKNQKISQDINCIETITTNKFIKETNKIEKNEIIIAGFGIYLIFIEYKDILLSAKKGDDILNVSKIIKFDDKINKIIKIQKEILIDSKKKYIIKLDEINFKSDLNENNNENNKTFKNSIEKINEKYLLNEEFESDENIISAQNYSNGLLLLTNKKTKFLKLDENSKTKNWEIISNGTNTADHIIEDIDNDGNKEIITSNKSGDIICLNKIGKIKWIFNNEEWNIMSPIILNKFNQKIIVNISFSGLVQFFSPYGILDINVEPSSSIMLDYGLYDLFVNNQKSLIGDLIDEIKIKNTAIDAIKISDSEFFVVSNTGKIYYFDYS